MAKIKRVFVVEGIDDGRPIAGNLIKRTNRLVEEEGLDVGTSARDNVLSVILRSGALARVLVYMTQSDIFGIYSRPGGVKKFIEYKLDTQNDVNENIAMINNRLRDAGKWLHVPPIDGQMPLSTLDGPEDSVVLLNMKKGELQKALAKPVNNKEEAAAVLEQILSHNHFMAHLNVRQAKAGVNVNATNVGDIINEFNFEAVTGFKSREERAAAQAEWKQAREAKAQDSKQKKSSSSTVETVAHKFAEWLEEHSRDHNIPKNRDVAIQFSVLAKNKLEELAPGDIVTQRKARDMAVNLTNLRNKGDWKLILSGGGIHDYVDLLVKRAKASGEKPPEDTPPPNMPPTDDKKNKPEETPDVVKDFGKNLKYGWWIKKSKDEPGKYQVGFSIKEDQSDTATSSPIKKISLDKSGDDGNGIASIETENSVYTAPVSMLRMVESHEAMKHLPGYSSSAKKLDLVDLFVKDFHGTGDTVTPPSDETPQGAGDASAKMPTHVTGALSDYAKNLKKIAKSNKLSTKDLLAAINKEIES